MWREKIAEWIKHVDLIGRRRELQPILGFDGAKALCADNRWRIIFCSNDYLGLKNHPKIIEALRRAASEWGSGSGASRLITGTTKIHFALEEKICEWLGYEVALLFGSGYLANIGTIEAFGSIVKKIFSDKLNHASIIDGCRLAKCEKGIYEHLDLEMLSRMLSSADEPSMIVTESVFSMEGDHPDLEKLSSIASSQNALLLVDEAHALGVYGERGRGLCSYLTKKPDILLGTCGKSLGSYGAFVATTKDIRDFLINRARTFIFSTAPSPSLAAASLVAIELIEKGEAPIEKLWENTRYFRNAANQEGLPINVSGGPIIPIIIGAEKQTLEISQKLWSAGFWVQPIRPPTVPEGSSRLRITISALHKREEIDSLIEALKQFITVI